MTPGLLILGILAIAIAAALSWLFVQFGDEPPNYGIGDEWDDWKRYK